MFNDPQYAWELLECEIAVELSECVSGPEIAQLLALYMRGVEKMNSILDVRESYFKNKVTSLMSRSNVVRTFTKNPMTKKAQPLEIDLKHPQHNNPLGPVTDLPRLPKQTPPNKLVGTTNLQQKKKEIELRLAYVAQEHSSEGVLKMVNSYDKKEEQRSTTIANALKTNDQQLNERIKRRKLKTSTFRSKPNETPNELRSSEQAIEDMDYFHNPRSETVPLVFGKLKGKGRSKSVIPPRKPQLSQDESPNRKRRMTMDFSNRVEQMGEDYFSKLKSMKQTGLGKPRVQIALNKDDGKEDEQTTRDSDL